MRKISTLVTALALLVSGLVIGLPNANAAIAQVSIFSFPGLTEGNGSCNDEVDNLEEIITKLDYGVDRTITGLTDTPTTLLSRLNASQFFFVPDMESAFSPANTAEFPATAVTAFQTWLTSGGVFVMTGTSGTKDIDFINRMTGWTLSSASALSPASRNDANVSGTAFDGSGNAITLDTPSATDAVDGSSAPAGANFKALWGTTSQASVATMDYGSGKIIFLGFDFWNAGYSGVNNYSSPACASTTNTWVTKITPAALEYATQLSGGGSAPAPASTPARPQLLSLSLKLGLNATLPSGSTLMSGSGLQAGSQYTLTLRSEPVVIFTGNANPSGYFENEFNLSSVTCPAPGRHTLTLTGIRPDGSQTSAETAFSIDESCRVSSTSRDGYDQTELATVYFNSGSSKLSNKAKASIKSAVEANPAAIYRVIGYVQESSSSRNDQSLSLSRARAVTKYIGSLDADVNFTVVSEAGLISLDDGKSAKARKATLFTVIPSVR